MFQFETLAILYPSLEETSADVASSKIQGKTAA